MTSSDQSSSAQPPSRSAAPVNSAAEREPSDLFPRQIAIDVLWTPEARAALLPYASSPEAPENDAPEGTELESVRAWNNALRRAVRAVCRRVPPLHAASTCSRVWSISAAFVSDAQMAEMNAHFRNKDKPTDVLSWSQNEASSAEFAFAEAPDAPQVWGDIAIAVETTRRQASERAHSNATEVLFLAIHGTLHLFGYDHVRDADRRAMWHWQELLFDELKPRL